MAPNVKAIVTYPPQDGPNWRLENVQLRELGEEELQVQIVATGICHTDLFVSSLPPEHAQYPIVLGHEGVGYVSRAGSKVTAAKVGDPVALSFASCASCRQCETGHPAYCTSFLPLNLAGTRECYEGQDNKITGKFFGQSSFANHTIVAETSVVNLAGIVKTEEELKVFAPFGCGFQTGSGTVVNLGNAGPEDTVAVIGLGGVGLCALMAAKLSRCNKIVAVDRVQSRLELAKSLGATHVFNTNDSNIDLVTEVRAATDGHGTTITIDTTGVMKLIEACVEFASQRGKIFFIGIPPPEAMLSLSVAACLTHGKIIQGSTEGDSIPRKFVPQMIDWYREGKFPVDRLIKYYPVDRFEEALHDMHSGATVKPVLVW